MPHFCSFWEWFVTLVHVSLFTRSLSCFLAYLFPPAPHIVFAFYITPSHYAVLLPIRSPPNLNLMLYADASAVEGLVG